MVERRLRTKVAAEPAVMQEAVPSVEERVARSAKGPINFAEAEEKRERNEAAPGGVTVTATWGEELFTPVAYNSFRVGPFTMSATTKLGETATALMLELNGTLQALAAAEFDIKVAAYKKRLGSLK